MFRRHQIAFLGAVLLSFSCSNTDLRQLGDDQDIADNKITITGHFCTTSPADLELPVKIIFVVDNSDSMNVTDPDYYPNSELKEVDNRGCVDCYNQRQRAVREIWERYEDNDKYWFSLITFPFGPAQNNGFYAATNGEFIQEPAEAYVGALQNPDGLSPLYNALQEAKRQIQADLLLYNERERIRLRYVVIVLTDGFPIQYDTDSGSHQILEDADDIKRTVRDMVKLKDNYNLGDVTVNTSYLQGDEVSNVDELLFSPQDAQQLMMDMALAGNGVPATFSGGDEDPVTFRDFDFSSFIRSFILKSLMVTNLNAVASRDGTLEADSDGDGLTDTEEIDLDMDPTNADADGDLVSDMVELIIGTDPLITGDVECAEEEQGDKDGDQLRDCEELLIGTSPYNFDHDLDGLTEYAEFLAGVGPAVSDALLDGDLDGVLNRDEVLQHTLPMTTDPANRPTLAYKYEIIEGSLTGDSRQCYDFTVSNISLVETLPNTEGVSGMNTICVYVIEASRDATLDDHGILRTGCLELQYLGNGEVVPPGKTLEVSPDDETRFARYE